ncbi:cache domain-containing sensor histidine kinase [Paenibacillus caui]|uniref:cache domain-containing sensor histidine kinase n=1 Tax=Paenibacillus caui TaxID=2873927 RepID=UPI001CA7BAAE|nr:sensor histidine kinase [Paenibacillus caui]
MFYSLRSRLMAAFSVLLILPFTALVIILSEASTKEIKQSIEQSVSQTIDQFASHAETLLVQVEDTGNQTLSSKVTQNWIATELNLDVSTAERVLAKQQLRDLFSSYAVNNSNGISLSAFTKEDGGMWRQDKGYEISEWYKLYVNDGARWTRSHLDPDQAEEGMRSRRVNSYIVPLVQLQSLRTAGVLKVNFPTELLQGAIDKISIGKTGHVFLLTADGLPVLDQPIDGKEDVLHSALARIGPMSGYPQSGVFPVKEHNTSYLIFYSTLPEQGWIIMGEVPEQELYVKITKIKENLLLISLGLLITAIICAFWLSGGITKPLSMMAKAMKLVQKGDFEQGLELLPMARTGHNEVSNVARVFEHMTIRLRNLIEIEFETNLRRKNAEYKALLLQINPHFYYNTLEIIGGLAAMKREALVMDATEALGKMMRYSLDLESEQVKVAEELNYIREYLFILKLRYGDVLHTEISADPAADSMRMTKFILQPLVENAVKYSLDKGDGASVKVSTLLKGEVLQLQVKDNGIGMTADLVADLLRSMGSTDPSSLLSSQGESIGLRNVLSRCRLIYGEKFGVTLNSIPGVGTEITLTFNKIGS